MRLVRGLVAVVLAVVVAYVGWTDWLEPAIDDEPSTVPATAQTTARPKPAASTLPPVVVPKGQLRTTLRRGAAALEVVPEDRQAYLRRYFGKGWADADKDCRDTRQEVLARESLKPVGSACRIYRGRWLSYYDNKTWTTSFQVQIDHLVPLAEAWDSGSYRWDGPTRVRFANDLGDVRPLVPTTTALNYAKVADDPQWYVPKVNACRYITSWIAVKLRWSLTVDPREKAAINRVVKKCPNARLTVKRARIGLLPFAAGTGTRSKDIRIHSLAYRGKSEKIVLRNRGRSSVTMVGWVVTDEVGYGQYRIPRTTLRAGRTLTIVSTKGKSKTDAKGNLVQHAGWGDVWNNTGDVATVIDGRRKVADTCRYRGDDSGKARC